MRAPIINLTELEIASNIRNIIEEEEEFDDEIFEDA